MKKLILLLIILFALGSISQMGYAQSNHEECGTKYSPEEQQYLEDTKEQHQQIYDDQQNNRITVLIPVQHHIFQEDDGTGATLNFFDIEDIMDKLNAAYDPLSIRFIECEAVKFHPDSRFFDYQQVSENAMLDKYEVDGVLNFYYTNTLSTNTNGSLRGYSSFPDSWIKRDLVVATQASAMNQGTLIHEVGHYFKLRHTHQGGKELVDRSNCTYEGDDLCDTPADPGLNSGNVTSCAYTGTAVDKNGDVYIPLVNNFMSSAPDECRKGFTWQQGNRVFVSAVTERDYLHCNGCEEYEYAGGFNYGEDFSSHDYTTTGTVYPVNTYDCISGNPQLRVGHCNTGAGSVSVTFNVMEATDKLKLRFRSGWSGGSADVYIDGFKRGTIKGNSTCFIPVLILENISNLTLDGKVKITVKDPSLGCSGDIILDYLQVWYDKCPIRNYFAPVPYFTSFEDKRLDDYWRTNRSHSKGKIELTEDHGPIYQDQHLVMHVDTNFQGYTRHITNEAWLHLDMGGCSNATLWFYWKEFFDESDPEDGVFFSDNGGEHFVKVLAMTGGAHNVWNLESLDVDALAAANGLSLTSTFVIKFQQRDNSRISVDGIAIDNVYVFGCNTNDLSKSAQNNHDELINQFNDLKDLKSTAPKKTSEFDDHFTIYPNPATNFTQFEFTIVEDESPTSLLIYDLTGKQVAQVLEATKLAGTYTEELDVSHLPSGVYLVILNSNGQIYSRRLMVHK